MSGRGYLIRKMLEESKILDSSGASQEDSDIERTSSDLSKLTLSGRGRIFQDFSSAETSSSSTLSSGRGRSQLLHNLLSSTSLGLGEGSQDITSTSSETSTSDKKIVSNVDQVQENRISLEPVKKHGNYGIATAAACNYIRLYSDPNTGVFEYEVRYTPSIDCKNLRTKLLNEHHNVLGNTKTFDGVQLYLPLILPNNLTKCISKHPATKEDVLISILYRRKKPLKDCIHLYNILFNRIMRILNYVRFDRQQYDPSAPKMIPQLKLEVWPGYITAVNELEDGIILCCDVSHRVLCQTTCLQTLSDAFRANSQNFKETAKKALLGSVILTRYNNRTYRIDNIDFDLNPLSTFQTSKGEKTYRDYYREQYNIHINDLKQPLLISIKKRHVANQEFPIEMVFCLIPEICYLTGLRDEHRADFKIMRELATFTRVTPNQRVAALDKFHRNINNCQEAREVLQNWGLKFDNKIVNLQGRQYPVETILFSNTQVSAGINAEFKSQIDNKQFLDIIHFNDWILIYTPTNSKDAKTFMEYLRKISNPIGLKITKPKLIELRNDRTESFIEAIRSNVRRGTQIIVCICPSNRADRYSAIKRICCSEIPIPSQVIMARSLSNVNRVRSIVLNIALQMNCKLGGALWSVNIPLKNSMICGIDTFHNNSSGANSVAGFVASLNKGCTRWYSRAVIQCKNEEIVNGLCTSLTLALLAYQKHNDTLPDKIIIFRDGVGDGQLNLLSNFELPQFEQACKNVYKNDKVLITFIVVQKRCNTKFFVKNSEYVNPNPGFVVDHTITRRYLYDFYLISQSVKQGCVTPSHYIVILDQSDFKPDILQRLSYKLCFMYYNWPGTISIPSCIQYAHKLAYLVGESVKRSPAEELADKLFYL